MRINGQDLSTRPRAVLKLPRVGSDPLAISISAFAFGTEEKIRRLFPWPTPPESFVLGRKGAVLQDPATGKPITRPELSDPEYTAAADLASARRTATLAYLAMRDDPGIEFAIASACSLDNEPARFGDGLIAEFTAAGFTSGDVELVVGAAMRLSNQTAKQVEEAADRFLSEASVRPENRNRSLTTPAAPASTGS